MLNFSLKKIFLKIRIVLFLFLFVLPFNSLEANIEDIISAQKYPKLANYFLSWSITDQNVKELAKWDFLILDMENQLNNPEKIKEIRRINPQIIILAYVPAEEIAYQSQNYKITRLRKELSEFAPENWYLHDVSGQRISFWPGSVVMNISNQAPLKNNFRWNTYLASFVTNKILSTGLWDGIYYDNTSSCIAWVNANIDLNNDHWADNISDIDAQWKEGTMKLLKLTREANPNFIVIGNSASDIDFQKYLNGRMFETFPTPWEGGGKWDYVTNLYLKKFPEKSLNPQIYIVNSNTNNTGVMDNYRKMRFGLTSTLLGKGYFSFDFGDKSHTQTWWYDEYQSFLGDAQSEAYNLLDKKNQKIKLGLWRRDFENAIVIVNSTNEYQTHVFHQEIFERINGQQDRRVNNGEKINWIRIAPQDGIVLLKVNKNIINGNYLNGSFFRVFNNRGQQKRNGFFTYQEYYPSAAEIINIDLDKDGNLETIVSDQGKLAIYQKGRMIKSFYPYTKKFKKHIFIASVDLNGDGQAEIITGAGPGGGPHIRIFNRYGELLGQFFAYNYNFYGGVSVAVGDVNGDGQAEIITGAGPGGKTEVKVLNFYGELLNNFFAYQGQNNTGIKVTTSDLDNNSISEILVSSNNF